MSKRTAIYHSNYKKMREHYYLGRFDEARRICKRQITRAKKEEHNDEDFALLFEAFLIAYLDTPFDLPKGIKLLEKALQWCNKKDHSQDHLLLRACGTYYLRLGNKSKAAEYFSRAIDANNKDWKAKFLKVLSLQEKNRKEEAIQQMEAALKEVAESLECLQCKVILKWFAGRNEEAIEVVDATLEDYPSGWFVMYYRAYALRSLGNSEEAIAWFDKALKVNSNDFNAMQNRGVTLEQLGKHKEAIVWYDKALKVNPNDSEAMRNRGFTLGHLGNQEDAIAWYDKALKVNPNDVNAMRNRADALDELGKHEEAIVWYDKALKVNPNDYNAMRNLGFALGKIDRHQEANKYFSKVLDLNPKDFDAMRNLGDTLFAIGKYPEAIGCYARALKVNPEDSVAMLNGGAALGRLGKHQEAITWFDRALEMNPEDYNAMLNLGASLGQLGKQQEAIEWCDKVLKDYPKQASAWNNKGVAVWNSGADRSLVLDCFDKAMRYEPKKCVSNYWRALWNTLSYHCGASEYQEAKDFLEKNNEVEIKYEGNPGWEKIAISLRNHFFERAFKQKRNDNGTLDKEALDYLRNAIRLGHPEAIHFTKEYENIEEELREWKKEKVHAFIFDKSGSEVDGVFWIDCLLKKYLSKKKKLLKSPSETDTDKKKRRVTSAKRPLVAALMKVAAAGVQKAIVLLGLLRSKEDFYEFKEKGKFKNGSHLHFGEKVKPFHYKEALFVETLVRMPLSYPEMLEIASLLLDIERITGEEMKEMAGKISEDVSVLSHYTSAPLVRSVLPQRADCQGKQNRVWLFSVHRVNDPTEGVSLVRYSRDQEQGKKHKLHHFFSGLGDDPLTRDRFKDWAFTCSFCEAKDQLDLWRLYGDKGKGVAIEVPIECFDIPQQEKMAPEIAMGVSSYSGDKKDVAENSKDLLSLHSSTPNYEKTEIWKVFYKNEEKERIIASIGDQLGSLYKIRRKYKEDKKKSKLVKYLDECVQRALLHILFLFKDEAYKSEKEYRLLKFHDVDEDHIEMRDSGDECWLYVPSDPFLFERPSDFKKTDEKPFSIVIGPANPNKRQLAHEVRLRLEKNGFTETTEVRGSICPYVEPKSTFD